VRGVALIAGGVAVKPSTLRISWASSALLGPETFTMGSSFTLRFFFFGFLSNELMLLRYGTKSSNTANLLSPDGRTLPVCYVGDCDNVANQAECKTLGLQNTMVLTSHPRWLGLLQALAGVAAVQVATLAEMQPEHGLEPVRLALATCAAGP
jgi:hypothetical protein